VPADHRSPDPVRAGERARHRPSRAVGLVLCLLPEAQARVAFEGAVPRAVPIDELERVW
jgi:hypothetical protein